MSEASEAELIAGAKESSEAFGALYERYVDRVYNYIYYRTGNHQDAEDLTARTFFRALKHIGRYRDRGAPFSAYLYRIAHNLVANWHRDTKRRQVLPFDELITSAVRREEPPAVAEDREVQDRLLRAVRCLAPDRQELLILKYVEQMTNADIAQVMGRTEGAVKSLYHRTLISLREEFCVDLPGADDEEDLG
jgi:RNA polymerase sigma-70 factor (ECF subfamily)